LGAAGLVASAVQRAVHPLVPAVLLRVAGLDPFDPNAEPQPPHGQLAESIERSG